MELDSLLILSVVYVNHLNVAKVERTKFKNNMM